MTRYIDLHTHSTASDGSYTPAEIVRFADELGLAAVALTDHDTVSGVSEFLEAGRDYPDVRTVPGVEISVRLEGENEAHIVGLFIDHTNEQLAEFLTVVRDNRNKRNAEMLRRLTGLGYDVSMEELLEISSGESVGRPAVAKLLVDKGYFESMTDVFNHCLRRGMPGYAPRVLPSPEEGIRHIHAAGGVAIWAHPVYRRKNERTYVRITLDKLTRLGLDGIETDYTVFTEAQHKMLVEFADRYSLIRSGGSDFHGVNQPSVALGTGFGGLRVPADILGALEARHRQRIGARPEESAIFSASAFD